MLAQKSSEFSQNLEHSSNKDTTNLIKINIGYDTEYVIYEAGDKRKYPDTVIAQLAVQGNYESLDHPNLVETIHDKEMTGWAFSPPKPKMLGLEYLKWLETCVKSILDVMGIEDETPAQINLLSFYSNAELSAIIPTKKQIAELIDETNGRVTIMPIQSSGVVKGMGITMSAKHTLNLKDTRLLTAKGSLKKLGDSLNFPKGEFDFNTHDARYYFEHQKDEFLSYGIRDAMIALVWNNTYHEQSNILLSELNKQGYIKPNSYNKLSEKNYLTVASTTDSLMHAVLDSEGKYQDYKNIVETLIERVIPHSYATFNKGGFNTSSHGESARFIFHQDGWDIKSAYITCMKNVHFPLTLPTDRINYHKGRGKWFSLKKYAKTLTKYPFGFIEVSKYQLPQNTPVNHRILSIYDSEGEPLPALSNATDFNDSGQPIAWKSQLFTRHELVAQSLVTPNGRIFVTNAWLWDEKTMTNTDLTCSFEKVFQTILDLRASTKLEYGSKSVQQEVIKLIGNGGVGKLAQNKKGFDSLSLNQTISKGGEVNSLAKCEYKSRCYNPFLFNTITGIVRSVVGMSYALSNGVLAVTDSVACSKGRFINSKQIATMIKNGLMPVKDLHFAKVLSWFDWDQERNDQLLMLFKERDYVWLGGGTNQEQHSLASKVHKGIATLEDLEPFTIEKIAKRGYHQPEDLDDSSKKAELIANTNKRFRGFGIKQKHHKLVKLNQMLHNDSMSLNQSHITGQDSPGMGTHNMKYDLDSLKEYDSRRRLKLLARRHGYPDILAVKIHNPNLYEKLLKKVKPRQKGNYIARMPVTVRISLGLVQILYGNSAIAEKKAEIDRLKAKYNSGVAVTSSKTKDLVSKDCIENMELDIIQKIEALEKEITYLQECSEKVTTRGLEKLTGIGKSTINRLKQEVIKSKNISGLLERISREVGYGLDELINHITRWTSRVPICT